ncbi:hypothetical protein [Natrialbaceae archaeon AArc-T1-2]|uniref:hypothetical protein n=1 Tax=Natrialbaceae archaeon AArc-T1-2 TaxID=3053904 RepID=UPI00255AA9E6|nr:hypothetical protein [Natrialbaceae archaeon AArc-T1-2]WIV67061.1 hypothetical protein QQ977_15455 [Natrialbaceae archaeon AArc-T1-2]
MQSDPFVRIDRIDVTGTSLECTVRPSPSMRRFFTGEPFRARYDVEIEDVPDGVLAIPVLAQVCPVAWTQGADVYVDEVDTTFAHALEDAETALRSLYPEFMLGGDLQVRETVDVAPDSSGDDSASGLLFTGGVDSTCSLVRHREEAPTLISVRGWTVRPDPVDDGKWADLRSRVTRVADRRDLEASFVESNMLATLDNPMLLAHFGHRVDGGWYSSVGHGLGLLGLCAPLAYARGLENLYVAATHWEGVDLEWGSRPEIDDHVRWAGTQCHHDGYELTRQERIDAIAAFVRETGDDLELQTCNDRMDGNCSACEKCYRTMVGLRLSGLDPNDHGYRFADADYADLRRSFERGEWVLGEDERIMWADIRDRVRETEPRSPVERAFFAWLEEVDLEDLVADAEPPLSHRLLRATARNAPHGVYNALYPAWTAAKVGTRRLGLR